MRTAMIFIAAGCLGLLSYGQPGLIDQARFTEKIDEYVKPFVDTKSFSGSILVAKKGEILYQKAFGLANEGFNVGSSIDTKYQIASLSKSFTAAAILLLEERRLLKITDTLSKYIPDFPNGNKITIHELLTHTSGIININDMPEYAPMAPFPQTPASLIAVFKNKPLEFEPGSKYSYSNSNYNVLAYIIEKVSGKTYGDFLAENIFTPLGMAHTAHRQNPNRIIDKLAEGYQSDGHFGLEKADFLDWTTKTGNGSLYSTAGDLYKWDQALYTSKILSDESRQKMFHSYIERTGYGWFIGEHLNRQRTYFNGRSPGFTAYFGRYPNDEVCIIVLANNYIPTPNRIGSDIAAILFGEKYEIPKIVNSNVDAQTSAALVGNYQFDKKLYRPNYLMTIRAEGGHLFSSWGELLPKSALEYTDRTYWLNVKFVKDSSGKIVSVDYGDFNGVRQKP